MSHSRPYDAIVAGVGTMGSAALYHLARRGRRVLGIERFGLAHSRGSMHGHSRIIRLAYHEHPDFVPLLRRAYELWRQLEAEAGTQLLHVTGSLEIGLPDGLLVSGALRAAREHELPFELLEPADIRRRFPAFEPGADEVGFAQPDGGYLRAEDAVRAHVSLAVAAGAELRLEEPVVDWQASGEGVSVRTALGEYHAARLVLAPGAWAADLLRLPPGLFVVERQILAWFEPIRAANLEPGRMPVFIVEEGDVHHYGFPAIDERGLKLGRMHYPGQTVSPDAWNREATAAEAAPLRSFLERRLPDAPGRLLDAQACLFTNTPDRAFLIDLHPAEPNVVVASVCSGHGFKFATVAGEILADLAEGGDTRQPIEFLRYARFETA